MVGIMVAKKIVATVERIGMFLLLMLIKSCTLNKYYKNTDAQLKISLRTFQGMDRESVIDFWLKTLKFRREKISYISILKGKKKGRLKYGMCRVRVSRGKDYFKLIMSMIDFIKTEI